MSPNEELVPVPLDVIVQEISNSSFLTEADNSVHDDVIPFEVKLDRNKLKEKYAELIEQKPAKIKKNHLLNRNLLKHFKVKKVYRAFSAEAADIIPGLQAKYKECLSQMDEAIARGKQVTSDCSQKLSELDSEKRQKTELLEANVHNLEIEIKEEGLKLKSSQTGFYLQEEVVDRMLKIMAQVRGSISAERLIFIKTIDKHTEIDQKAKLLEDLGNGLHMIDFEQLRAERESLGDKIEERINELGKLHLRCYSDTQILAHVREKEFMLDNVLAKESHELGIIARELADTRNYANQMNYERDVLRKDFSNKTKSCGLLNNPMLLSDYDLIVKIINDRTKTISFLKKRISKMVGQISAFERI